MRCRRWTIDVGASQMSRNGRLGWMLIPSRMHLEILECVYFSTYSLSCSVAVLDHGDINFIFVIVTTRIHRLAVPVDRPDFEVSTSPIYPIHIERNVPRISSSQLYPCILSLNAFAVYRAPAKW